ncbi:hypothetical protein [Kineococcus rubinsiae]|uniref:hypothetical protein n=1 Tax=Kineococcus rubinsiae TaxID=2609562 RepID=UPI0014322484|nr:hypothetical protein [Kineococcus rubinsiae]NIZ90319.1 hypothetical protein [Kineococcus rubinsiae]
MTTPTTPRPDDSDLRAALRSLDPAAAALTAQEQQRAGATLERILATDPSTEPATGAGHPHAPARQPARRHPGRRVLLSGAAAATLTFTCLTFLNPGDDDMAYASWTPQPAPLSEHEIDVVAPACRAQLRGGSLDLQQARLVLAERRGDHVVLLYRTEDPDMSGACLARNPRGSADVDDVSAGAAGSDGPAQVASARAFTQGAIFEYHEASVTDGAVGTEVLGVTIHAGAILVRASVAGGRYVAWWPGTALEHEPAQPSGRRGPEPVLTYDLTLVDGTVLHDVQPTLPS